MATTGKSRSTKDLRQEVRQCRARLAASASRNVLAELEIKNPKTAKQHRSLATRERGLISEKASVAEVEGQNEQQPSGLRTATIKQLIDALVLRARGKAYSEIAQIVYEITERLNELKRLRRPSTPDPERRSAGKRSQRRLTSDVRVRHGHAAETHPTAVARLSRSLPHCRCLQAGSCGWGTKKERP